METGDPGLDMFKNEGIVSTNGKEQSQVVKGGCCQSMKLGVTYLCS